MGAFESAGTDWGTERAESAPAVAATSAVTQTRTTPFRQRAVVANCTGAGLMPGGERGQCRAR